MLTSNASRELSEALKRRCLYLHLDYPDAEREREIVTSQVPDLDDRIAEPAGRRRSAELRELELKKAPSIAESVDWARTLVALEIRDLDEKAVADTLGVVLKHASDHAARRAGAAARRLTGSGPARPAHLASSRRCARPGCRVARRGPRRGRRAGAVGWGDRAVVAAAYAATLVKKQAQRTTFDALFDVYFPALVGEGVRRRPATSERGAADARVRDNAAALTAFRDRAARRPRRRRRAGSCSGWRSRRSAGSARCPAAGPGCRRWSAYTALQRVVAADLVDRIVAALLAQGTGPRTRRDASPGAGSAPSRRMVEADARRRIAEEKGPDHVADVAIRPSIDRLDFTAARQDDLEEMRRADLPAGPAARHPADPGAPRPAPRPARLPAYGPGLDLHRRRPLTTHHKPKRPHRTELVVLCDVSGSVANFAQFTLLLVFALRDQFQKVRAFTFIDHVHEVTEHFLPGADVVDVMADARRQHRARRAVGPHQLRAGVHQVRRAARRRARAASRRC